MKGGELQVIGEIRLAELELNEAVLAIGERELGRAAACLSQAADHIATALRGVEIERHGFVRGEL